MVRIGTLVALSTQLACSDGEPAIPTPYGSPNTGFESEPDSARDADAEPSTGTASDSDATQDAGSDAEDTGCPHDLPATCPSPAPSWMNDVQPIISQRCNACHGVGGVEQSRFDFSTYQGVHKSFGSIISNVNSCLMPPPDAGSLTPAERQALLGWLVCAAPNN